MNSPFEQEIRYRVLKLVRPANLSQRAVAGKLGIMEVFYITLQQ